MKLSPLQQGEETSLGRGALGEEDEGEKESSVGGLAFFFFLVGRKEGGRESQGRGVKKTFFLDEKMGGGSASRGEMAKKTRTGWTSDRAREVDDREFKQLLDCSRILSWVSESLNLVL